LQQAKKDFFQDVLWKLLEFFNMLCGIQIRCVVVFNSRYLRDHDPALHSRQFSIHCTPDIPISSYFSRLKIASLCHVDTVFCKEQYRQQNAVDPDRREFLTQQRKLAIATRHRGSKM